MTAFRYAMYFGVYGPLIGAAVLFMVIAPISFGGGGNSGFIDYLMIIPMTLAYSIWIVPVALILGIIPGIVTGLVYGWLRSRAAIGRLPVSARVAMMAIIGGAACVLFGVSLGAALPDMLSREIIALFITPGIVAASACTWLAERRLGRPAAE